MSSYVVLVPREALSLFRNSVSSFVHDMPFPSKRIRNSDRKPKDILSDTRKESLTYERCYSDLFGKRGSPSPYPDSSPSPITPPIRADGSIIHSLPNEVLCEIFSAGRHGISANEGLWLLAISGVCLRWRTVATRTPSLWTNIYFGDNMLSERYTDACLTRSQNCPLHITFRIDGDRRRQKRRRLLRHIGQVTQHTCRWRNLEIHAHSPAALDLILTGLRSLEQLLQFIITLESTEVAEKGHHLCQVDAPHLTHIALYGVSFISCNMPPDHLTVLTITRSARRMKNVELKRILMASSSLTKLCLSGDVASLGQKDWFTIRIPSLTSLTLLQTSEDAFGHLCNTIVAPSLQLLTLHNFSGECIRSLIDACRLSSPKYPSLHSFELHTVADLELSSADIIDLFDELSEIQNFSMIALRSRAFRSIWPLLYWGDWENLVPSQYHFQPESSSHVSPASDFLSDISVVPSWLTKLRSAMKAKLGRRALLPRLQVITVSSLDGDNLPQACIMSMSRLASGLPLTSIRAYSMPRTTSPVQTLLKECTRVEMVH